MGLKAKHENTEIDILATHDGHLIGHAITETEFEHNSGRGNSWIWQSANVDIDVNDTLIAVRNDTDSFLIWTRMLISPGNVAMHCNIGIGEATTTMAGTTITGRNPNGEFLGKSPASLATAIGDETALADADLIFTAWGSTTETKIIPLDGLVCVKGQYLQVNSELEATSGRIALFGHFSSEVV
jgi:hypothetical protein|tara:strand:- start:758 stop:1309 length:552 start_codon:yes stop_codon:yes gene_type:complete